MATLNCHLAYTGQKMKFWGWERFLSECSRDIFSEGVGECLYDMLQNTSKHCNIETLTSVWRFKCGTITL